jgi:solute carrier family 50 protein (sugar transporter)
MKKESKIIAPNTLGLFMATYYSLKFCSNCPKNASNLPGTMDQHIKIGSAMILFTMLAPILLGTDMALSLIGKVAIVVCVVLFASPLAALKTVIETKSARSIPLPFTLACMLNCFLWSVAGVLDMKDFYVYFPNILGLLSTIAQISLYFIYGNKPSSAKLPL